MSLLGAPFLTGYRGWVSKKREVEGESGPTPLRASSDRLVVANETEDGSDNNNNRAVIRVRHCPLIKEQSRPNKRPGDWFNDEQTTQWSELCNTPLAD